MIGKACREAVEGTYPDLHVNYGKIQISAGRLQLPTDIHLHLDPLSHTATFSWNAQLVYPFLPGSANDRINIVCFDPVHPAEVKTSPEYIRAVGKAVVTLDEMWHPATTHFWIYFTSHDLQDISNSVYIQPE